MSAKGRSPSSLEVMSGVKSCSRLGGGWYSSCRRVLHLSSWVVAFGRSGPLDIGRVGYTLIPLDQLGKLQMSFIDAFSRVFVAHSLFLNLHSLLKKFRFFAGCLG